MRVAVTGAAGRLGRALIAGARGGAVHGPDGTDRVVAVPTFDLDTLTDASVRCPPRARPARGRDPRRGLDRRRRLRPGARSSRCAATGTRPGCSPGPAPPGASTSCSSRPTRCSTGARTDGLGYGPRDEPNPINPYGASQGRGRAAGAVSAFEGAAGVARLAIVRTSWLHGPPGNDFPAKIAAAALRARAAGEPLRVVGDEIGCPTYTPDLAEAIVELLGARRTWRPPGRRGRSTTSSTAAARRAPTGRARCCGSPASTSRSRRCRPRPGSAPRRRRCGPSSSRRRSPRASRCATGARPSRTPCRRCCGRCAGADRPGTRVAARGDRRLGTARTTPPRTTAPPGPRPHHAPARKGQPRLTIPRLAAEARASEAGRAFIPRRDSSPGRPSSPEPPRCASSPSPSSPRSSSAWAPSPRPARPPPSPRPAPRSRSSSAPRTARPRSTAPTRTRSTPRRSSTRPTSSRSTARTRRGAKVKAAVNGASIVVYLGHGNGWPSPYTYDPNYTTKDGFGLNYDINGDGKLTDYENKYYGEPSIRTLTPAPNAVVLLFHLCYASGNSEPGSADPSLSDGEAARRQLRRGVPQGRCPRRHRERPQPRARTTSTRCSRPARRSTSTGATRPTSTTTSAATPSTRTPGYTYQMDPEGVGKLLPLDHRQDDADAPQDVTGAALREHRPRTRRRFVVPGQREPDARTARPCTADPRGGRAGVGSVERLPFDAKVRIDEQGRGPRGDGSPIFRMHTDGGAEGWMTGSHLRPAGQRRRRGSGRRTRGSAPSRRTATAPRTTGPSRSACRSRRRGRSGCSTGTVTRSTSTERHRRHGRADVGARDGQRPRRRLHVAPGGDRRLGQRPADDRGHRPRRHAGARALGRGRRRRDDPAVHAQRRRLARHDRVLGRLHRARDRAGATSATPGGREVDGISATVSGSSA